MQQAYGFSYLDQVSGKPGTVSISILGAEKCLLGTPNRIPISRIFTLRPIFETSIRIV